jgi:DNA helicase-2/ATP-dependent DNA helicase PcrA
VTLMTLHAAKGLEFDAVFVAGCEEELLPHSRALSETRGGDPDAGLEEERRLLYVGMTRARARLYLSWARERMQFGSFSARRPSRFLEEIPRRLVEGLPGADEDPFLAEEALPAEPEFRAGDRVEHAHFGRGTVLRVQGTGANARATVRFPEHGERQLLLCYARLQLLGRAGA